MGSRIRRFLSRKRRAISRLGRVRRSSGRGSGDGSGADGSGTEMGRMKRSRKEDVDELWTAWYNSVHDCGNIAVAVQDLRIEENENS